MQGVRYFFWRVEMCHRGVLTAVGLKYRPVGITDGQSGKFEIFQVGKSNEVFFIPHQRECITDNAVLERKRFRRIQVSAKISKFHALR